MMFNPEGSADMKDRYYFPNGRSYSYTIGLPTGSVAGWTSGVSGTPGSRDATISNTNPSDLNPCTHAIPTTDSDTLARPSQPARLLIVLSATRVCSQTSGGQPAELPTEGIGGGEFLNVMIDSPGVPAGAYFQYATQPDHLSDDAENFGGLMTETIVTP
jgi:hypothetical protein